jgi:hypothetical protein
MDECDLKREIGRAASRLLQRILGPADSTEDSPRGAEHAVPTRPGQDGERLPVPALGQLDEIAVHAPPVR